MSRASSPSKAGATNIRKVADKGGWVIIRVEKKVPRGVLEIFGKHIDYWLGTSLIDESRDKLWNTLKDAKEGDEENAKRKNDQIKDWNDDPNGC